MNFIEINDATFAYGKDENPVIRQLTLEVREGEFLAIAGSNGSGKSTLLRLINGLILPHSGTVMTAGLNTSNPQDILPLRKTTGMVFQEPENQLTATVVEEDTAFGPENLAFEPEKMVRAVEEALDLTGLGEFKKRSTSALSAGQLQRLALAGVLAMNPRCLLLDEPTSMLNPQARRRFLDLILRLNREKGLTVLMVSHHFEELLAAPRLILMNKGRIVRDGDPHTILQERDLEQWGLTPPPALEASRLIQTGEKDFPSFTGEKELASRLGEEKKGEDRKKHLSFLKENFSPLKQPFPEEERSESQVRVEKLTHDYLKGTLLHQRALEEVSFCLKKGETACLIGTTGSGKSTLLQHLNGLLLADEGEVSLLGGRPLGPATTEEEVLSLRRKVGLVMQRPEKQLFERYVGDDVAFAPRQMGLKGKKLSLRVKDAMDRAGLPFQQFKDRPTFALSGGEKRKAALAGVLAMEPEILLLDEPSAGLDPLSRRDLHRILGDLQERGITLIIATHDMDEAALLGHQILLMDKGKVALSGSAEQVFSQGDELRRRGLEPPFIKRLEEEM
ncbi:MAG: energy-coupling factor transporter ATPase [Spirochaetales bacterium]|nr:energy-coupling factor transporter ATPase [Spirochaetales bacterium]